MKKLTTFLILVLFGTMAFYSCVEETFTEEDAIEAIFNYETSQDSIANLEDKEDELIADSLYDANILVADSLNANWVVLTIKVVDASGDFSAKSGTNNIKGQSGATVTINVDGETMTETTGADGAASFTGLKTGKYAVNVAMPGFTTVDFVTETSSYAYYSVQVPVLQTGTNLMTITGIVSCETNLLNTSREAAAGVMVIAQPNLPDFFGNIPGVVEISYSGYTNTATTNASGSYSIDVPSDKAGELNYDIFVPTFEANQTLMLNEFNGVDVTGAGNAAQTVATRFGTELSGSETAVPAVNPVYCVFGPPTHVLTPAVLTVETDNNNGVDKAYVSNAGTDYYDLGGNPRVTITNNNPDGNDAQVELHVHDATGQIEWIEVISSGSDFTSTPTLDLSFEQNDAEIVVNTVDGSGAITSITLTDGGEYLTNKLSVTGGTGTGAEFTIGWNAATNSYEVTGLSDGGQDFTASDNLTALVPTTPATGVVTMQTPYISSIQVTNEGSGYELNTTYDIAFSTGMATATAYTDAYGRVYRAEVTSGSYNYGTLPTATVDYNLINENASANVFVQDGEIKSLFNTVGGVGYDNLPSITFYNQYTAGNPVISVDYDITINSGDPYDVTGVTINDGGSGISENLSTKTADSGQSNVESVPGGTIYVDFYLGTGVRTAGN